MMYYINDNALILTLAIIARLIGGFVIIFNIHKKATSMFQTPFYAYI